MIIERWTELGCPLPSAHHRYALTPVRRRLLTRAAPYSFAPSPSRITINQGHLLQMLHADARDAAARDTLDGEPGAVVFDGITLIEQPSGAREQESGDGRVVVRFGQLQLEF